MKKQIKTNEIKMEYMNNLRACINCKFQENCSDIPFPNDLEDCCDKWISTVSGCMFGVFEK